MQAASRSLCLLGLTGLLMVATAGAVWAQTASWSDDRGETGDRSDLLALGPDVAQTVGPPAGPPLTGAVLAARTDEVSEGIRCPVCQGHSIKDSPSESARNMKRQARAMVAAGYAEEQVLDYFETSYGEFIRTKPKAEGFNLVVWWLPASALLLGLGLVTLFVRQRMGSSEATGAPEAETPSTPKNGEGSEVSSNPRVDPWVARVRAQVESRNG